MKTKQKAGILLITPFFSPNIGGVETHLDDLVAELNNQNYQVYVHTYSPITSTNTKWKAYEKYNHITIYRYRWFGRNIFHYLEKMPFFDFLYLTPYLFISTFIWMVSNQNKINTIHSHGFNGAFVGLIIQKIFHKKHINSTHTIYSNSSTSITATLVRMILNRVDIILTQSNTSAKQLVDWKINPKIIFPYRYWLNLNKFKPNSKSGNSVRHQLNIKNTDFVVLSVCRLITKKGIRLLAQTAVNLPKIRFIFIGTGPNDKYLSNLSNKYKNIIFLGKIPNIKLPNYYNAADVFCSPVLYDEGYSRTIMESIACGTPVLSSKLGTIPEIVSSKNSLLIIPTLPILTKNINKLYIDTKLVEKLKSNCRPHALKYYSNQNINLIIKHYA